MPARGEPEHADLFLPLADNAQRPLGILQSDPIPIVPALCGQAIGKDIRRIAARDQPVRGGQASLPVWICL
jgi:hypothetical protein